ncbi:MAG: leucine-rich repeat domain-containing protein, partial [Candidatus Gallimonas sp.]
MIKKKNRLRIFIGTLGMLVTFLAAAVFLTACGGNELSRPNGLYVDDISQYLTLNWNNVRNAAKYEIEINETRVEVRRNTYVMDELAPDTYSIRVRALGDGMMYSDSDWSEAITYTKEADSGLRYRLTENYTAYEVAGIGTAEGEVVVDDYYRGKPVVRIAESAFSGSSKLTGIVLGQNVKTIAKRAFANCSTLESVTIPEGVTSLGEYAFQRCISLKSVSLPDSLTQISDYAFSSCKALESVEVGDSLKSIGIYAFSGCAALEEVSLPDSLTVMSEYAFYTCASLKSVRIGNGLTEIAPHAFDTCESLTTVEIPAQIVTIGEYAFARCKALTGIVIPSSAEKIGG